MPARPPWTPEIHILDHHPAAGADGSDHALERALVVGEVHDHRSRVRQIEGPLLQRVGQEVVPSGLQQRPAGSRRPQEGCQAVEQPEPGRLRLDWWRRGQIRQTVPDSGNHLGDVAGTRTQVVAQPRHVTGLGVRADDLDQGRKAGASSASQQRPHSTKAPRAVAWAATSSASRVLPIPGSPASSTTPPRPAAGIQVGGEYGQFARTADERCL